MAKEPWHAVSIVPAAGGCSASVALRGKRMLSNEAPRLPLPDCTVAWKCACTYRHYGDRRGLARRASERGLPERAVMDDKRRMPGRRADDLIGHR